ncbi:MAG: HemY protein [Candidatus Endobugula sp.]|jgi:HemY protein
MKKILLIFCLILVAVSFLVYKIQQEGSYFLIILDETSIELNLWFAVGIFLLASFVVWLIITIANGSVKKIYSAHQKIISRSEKQAQFKTTQGLIAFIAGDCPLAHKKLVLSAKNSSSPIVNYLAAAQCAYDMGEEKEALQLLDKAEEVAGDNSMAIALTQTRMQLSSKHYEKALVSLSRAEKINPTHKIILGLKKSIYVGLADWSALKKLLPTLHEKNIGTLEERYYLEKTLCQETVKDNIEKNATLTNEQRATLLEGCVNNLPAHFRKDSAILTLYINTLIELNAYDSAAKVLARNINREWNESWVRQYGLLIYSDAQSALAQAESWLKQEQSNAVLLLTLGRLCLQNQQWGRAKDFLLSSITIKPLAESYAELARLQRYLGDEKDSQQSYQQGLINTAAMLLDVPELA